MIRENPQNPCESVSHSGLHVNRSRPVRLRKLDGLEVHRSGILPDEQERVIFVQAVEVMDSLEVLDRLVRQTGCLGEGAQILTRQELIEARFSEWASYLPAGR